MPLNTRPYFLFMVRRLPQPKPRLHAPDIAHIYPFIVFNTIERDKPATITRVILDSFSVVYLASEMTVKTVMIGLLLILQTFLKVEIR